MKQGRVMKNIEGTIRTIDCGNGVYELRKDIDVLAIIPQKKQRNTGKILFALGTVGIFTGAAVALILLAPAFSTILMAVVAWCMFAAINSKEE